MGRRKKLGIHDRNRKILVLSLYETYKRHKISPERRKFTNSVLKSLRSSKEKVIREGEIYCIDYRGEKSTDKWHVVSISLIHEIFSDTIVVHNLLYLREETVLKLLKKLENTKDYRNSETKLVVENELTKFPWICTRVEMRKEKIAKFVSIDKESWGMIPLVEKHLFGNLNAIQLTEDWKRQNLSEQKTSKTKKEIKPLEQEIVIEDVEQPTEFTFEESDKSTSLADVRNDILDDDDNDI